MSGRPAKSFLLPLLAGVILTALSLYGFVLLRSRPGLPGGISARDVVRIDDFEIRNSKDIEFVLTQRRIGDWADFELRRNGQAESVRARLIAHYSRVPFPLIYLLTGLFCTLIGFTVFFLRWRDGRARVLYWLAVVFAYCLIISGGTYCLGHGWLSYVPAGLFYFLYPLNPALLVHFSFSFGRRPPGSALIPVYLLSLLFAVFFVSTVLAATLLPSIAVFRLYSSVFHVFRVYLVLLILLAISRFVLTYRRASLEEEKAPVKWVFLGLILGLGPFIFLYLIPVILKVEPVIGEETSTVFCLFIPIAFAFSIVRFRLLDVDLVINRGLVYSLLTIFTVGLYLFSVRVLEGLLARVVVVHETTLSIAGALLAAVAFHPARKGIQGFVDRSFFRQGYDYRKAVLEFSETSQKPLTARALVDEFIGCIESILPVDRLAVSVSESGAHGSGPIRYRGWKAAPEFSALLDQPCGRILARWGAVATEVGVDFSRGDRLGRFGSEILIPLPVRSPGLCGFLALGRKKSGQKFGRDDLDLLTTLSGELALSLDRIRLQEEVVAERASKEKLDELNRLKTEFISSVSHELRTPLSSIQGLIELLHEGKIKAKAEKEETLDILASESGRLSRLLHNIIDFGKIEQQAKTYHLEKLDVRPLIEEALRVFRRCLDEAGIAPRVSLPRTPVRVMADRDAVKQAVLNLLDNAIKYSPNRKELDVEVLTASGAVEVRVSDRGIGLPAGLGGAIFEKFNRSPEAERINPRGAGLGLAIVRHIMSAHRGEVVAESRPGGGSIFKLVFPGGLES